MNTANYPDIKINQALLSNIAKAIDSAETVEDIADVLTTLEHLTKNANILTECAEDKFDTIICKNIEEEARSLGLSLSEYLARKITDVSNQVFSAVKQALQHLNEDLRSSK